MKQILAYSLMLFFIAVLSAPLASFAAEDFETHKGQVPANTADLSDRPQEAANVVTSGIACEACTKNATAAALSKNTNSHRGIINDKEGDGKGQDEQR